MVSKRARASNTVGTRLNYLKNSVDEIKAKTRTSSTEELEERIARLEELVELLSSPNYRAEQEMDIWDARYTQL